MYPEFADRCAVDLVHDLTYNLRDGYVEPEDENETIAPAITLPSIVEETTDDEEDDQNDGDDDDVTEGDEVDDEHISSTIKTAARYSPTRRRRCLSDGVMTGGRPASSFEDGIEEGNSVDGYENENYDDDGEGCSDSEDGPLDSRFGSSPSGGGVTCSIPLLGSPPTSSMGSRSGHAQLQHHGGDSVSHSWIVGSQGLQQQANCSTPNSDGR